MHVYNISHMLGIVTSHSVISLHLGSLIHIAGISGNKQQSIPLTFKNFVFACMHFNLATITDEQNYSLRCIYRYFCLSHVLIAVQSNHWYNCITTQHTHNTQCSNTNTITGYMYNLVPRPSQLIQRTQEKTGQCYDVIVMYRTLFRTRTLTFPHFLLKKICRKCCLYMYIYCTGPYIEQGRISILTENFPLSYQSCTVSIQNT